MITFLLDVFDLPSRTLLLSLKNYWIFNFNFCDIIKLFIYIKGSNRALASITQTFLMFELLFKGVLLFERMLRMDSFACPSHSIISWFYYWKEGPAVDFDSFRVDSTSICKSEVILIFKFVCSKIFKIVLALRTGSANDLVLSFTMEVLFILLTV